MEPFPKVSRRRAIASVLVAVTSLRALRTFSKAACNSASSTAFSLRSDGSLYDAMIQGAKGYWIGYGVDQVKQIKVELND